MPTPRTSLSVMCPTRDPGPRVAALLADLRGIAQEIVVIANVEVSDLDLAHYASAADRVIRYPFSMPGERVLQWAHDQCAGDWVLTVHGDEVLSPGLVAEIAWAVQQPDVVQWWIPRRWAWPDTGRWIDELPWSPDFQLRLVRNDPATLWFPGVTHTAAAVVEPLGYLSQPLYHLDLLINPVENRTHKGAVYEADRPDMQAPGGGPQNLYYLPEVWSRRPVADVPDHDRAALERVLAGVQGDPPPVRADDVPLATREEIDARWNRLPVGPGVHHGTVTLIESDARLAPGETRGLLVRVDNAGGRDWPAGLLQEPRIRVGHRWWNTDGTLRSAENPRSHLTRRVAPGAYAHVMATVTAPRQPGLYALELDLLHEDVTWFGTGQRWPVWVGAREVPTEDEPAAENADGDDTP